MIKSKYDFTLLLLFIFKIPVCQENETIKI